MSLTLPSRLFAGICIFFSISSANAQTFTQITYAGSGLPNTTTSEADALAGDPSIDGYTHYTVSSNTLVVTNTNQYIYTWPPGFNGTSLLLYADYSYTYTVDTISGTISTSPSENYFVTDVININYVFQPGYNYYLTVNYSSQALDNFTGLGVSIGTPQTTTDMFLTGSAMTAQYGTSNQNVSFGDGFLANPFYSELIPIYNSNPASVTIPVPPVSSPTTGLNLEALPSPNTGPTALNIQSITIVGVPLPAGTSPLCRGTTQNFSVANTAGWPISWSISPSTVASLSPSGNSVAVTATGNSATTLTATYTAPNGQTYAANFPLQVGTLSAPGAISTSTAVFSHGVAYSFLSVGANFWSTNGTIFSGQGDFDVRIRTPNSGSILDVWAYSTNTCGTSPSTFASYPLLTSDDGVTLFDSANATMINPTPGNPTPGLLSATSPVLYPNPSTNSFQVLLPPTDFTKTYLKIFDIGGHLVQTIIPNSQSTLVDASHWAKGTYIVSIFDGTKLTTQKLVKL